MIDILITCLCFLVVSAICFVITKIVDWYDKRNKPLTEKSKFISDCYKLQIKYSKKGNFEFAAAMALVIESFNLPPEEKIIVTTADGQDTLKRSEEAAKDLVDEF